MKLTKTQVQKQIQTETINGETIYYSYAEKYQATLSMFKNDRLLIFNYNSGLLYYINEPKQLPFKTEIPKQKNQAANMNVSIAKNTSNSNQLHVQFVMKNQKNQSNNVEWSFLLQNKTLAQDWLRVIQAFKNKKIQEMMEAEEKKKLQTSKINNNKTTTQNQKVNNAWIHDTLGFGLMEVANKPETKPEPKSEPKLEPKPQIKPQPETTSPPKKLQQPKKPAATLGQSQSKAIYQPSALGYQSYPSKLTQSKYEQPSPPKSPQKPIQKSPSKQTPIKVPQSNLNTSQTKHLSIRESNISIRETEKPLVQGQNKNVTQSNVVTSQQQQQQQTNVIKQSSITPSKPVINYSMVRPQQNESSILRGSRPNPNQLSPSIYQSRIDSQIDQRQSKLTLRDQLQSILERSQMRQSRFESSYMSAKQSRISQKNYKPQNDWNLKFLKKQNQDVLIEFENYAKNMFMSIMKQDQSSEDNIRVYFKPESFICVANARTIDAKKLKSQFRNYHFIMQSCKDNFIIGVPLSCLIQYEGVVALVQSLIPEDAPKIQLTQQVMNQLKDLQRYTRVKNNVLRKAALYDLTGIYQSKERRLIYVNQLIQYLPVHLEESFRGGLLRPEHILDNVNQFMQGGLPQEGSRQDIKTLHDALALVQQNVKQLAKHLSSQEIVFANGYQLKVIMHQRGINLKYLPLLYSQVSNKTLKKYIHTFMAAKIGKDYILQKFVSLRSSSLSSTNNNNNNKTTPQEIVEGLFRLMLEGNSPASNQLWKEIVVRFKKQYNLAMTHSDLSGAFLLHTLIKLIPGKYDLTKLNDKKIFFRDDGIINKGFIAELIPKVKSYYRFTTELTDKIIWTCRQQRTEENFRAIVDQMKLNSQQIPKSFELSKVNEDLKEYLSYYACPAEFESKSYSHLKLFESVGTQPPSYLSMSITKNYLKWCLDKQKLSRFKQLIEQTLPMIDYWFDPSHIFHCDFLQLMGDYFEMIGSVEDSIKLIKQSLSLCLKNGASVSKKTGEKYFNLAEKELRAGRKKDSMQNFLKAKSIMQSCSDDTSLKYSITLMKLSSLYLNSNDFQNCVIYSKRAIQKFEQLQNTNNSNIKKNNSDVYDRYCIKAIEIMSRAFEIENKKNEFYRVAQMCSAKYNRTVNTQVFEQMIKLCLTAVIMRHTQQKCSVFSSFIQRASNTSQSSQLTPERAINQLMTLAQQGNIMQKFMFKFESLERIVADFNSKRSLSKDTKEFLNIVRNISCIVGEDYIYGLVRQKQLE